MKTYLLTLTLLLLSGLPILSAEAESSDPVEVYCGADQLHIYGTTWEDERLQRPKVTSGTIYKDSKFYKIECTVNSHKVVANFAPGNSTGGERGSCPGAWISLSIDNRVILSNEKLGGCFQALTFIGVTKPGHGSSTYILELCGHTEPMSPTGFDGCVKENSENLSNKKLPLRGFPVLDLLPLNRF